MASNKIGRTNDDIQRVLSGLLRTIKDPRVQQGMLSVTRVDTTSDLRQSKIYLSSLNLSNEKEFQAGLKSASGWLRRELGHSLSLRYTPELVFIIDHSIEHGAYISGLLSGLDPNTDDPDLDDEEDGKHGSMSDEYATEDDS